MKTLSALSLIALIPAAFAPVQAGAANVMQVQICSGDGITRTIDLPLLGKPGREEGPCCAKGCHSGSQRKRAAK